MSKLPFDLGWVIDPIPLDKFFNEYWEKKPLIIKREAPDYYASLLTSVQIEKIVSVLDPKRHEFDMVNADESFDRSEFIDDDGRVDAASVYRLFDKGATMILQRLNRRHPELARFVASMESEFSHPFQTNIYFTPAGAKGFKTHYDTHDVLILQIEGGKDWSIYDLIVDTPLSGQHFDKNEHEVGEVTESFRLNAGDMVYIPRGYMHDARSLDDKPSLHITTGVMSYAWSDFVVDAIGALCLEDPAFRKALPPGFAKDDFDSTQMKKTFRDLMQQVVEKSEFEASHSHFKDLFVNTRKPVLDDQLRQLMEIKKLSLDSEIAPRENLIYQLTGDLDDIEGTCQLNSYGQIITLPAYTAPALQFALEQETFTIKDLPGDLDDEGKLVLVRRLVREGLLQVQGLSQPDSHTLL